MALVTLLGNRLLSKNGEVATADVLEGKKHIMIYFSAHWCPPCRGFTPKLAQAYKASPLADKDTIVVYVSSDKDQDGFDGYYGEMPWYAVPFSEREIKNNLSGEFGVQGIPMLLVLDDAGKIVTKNGRAEYMKYLPETAEPGSSDEVSEALISLLGEKLLSKTGEVATAEVAATMKYIMVYFSAHWCPPCRGFTPQLVDAYNQRQAQDTMIVFVSSDRDKKSFDDYYGEMPWHAVPFEEQDAKMRLSETFGVSGIPSLVVLDSQGNVVTKEGRSMFNSYLGAPGHGARGNGPCCVIS